MSPVDAVKASDTEPDHGSAELDTEVERVGVGQAIVIERARVRSRLESHFVGHGPMSMSTKNGRRRRLVVDTRPPVAGHEYPRERTPVGPVYDALVQPPPIAVEVEASPGIRIRC